MDELEMSDLIRKEKQKIIRELRKAKISRYKMKVLDSVIDNVAFMKVKLDEIREMLLTEDLLVEYDNGGGQKGLKESPIFKQYQSLFANFMKGMDKILQPMPDVEAAQDALVKAAKPESVLDQILKKRNES